MDPRKMGHKVFKNTLFCTYLFICSMNIFEFFHFLHALYMERYIEMKLKSIGKKKKKKISITYLYN